MRANIALGRLSRSKREILALANLAIATLWQVLPGKLPFESLFTMGVLRS